MAQLRGTTKTAVANHGGADEGGESGGKAHQPMRYLARWVKDESRRTRPEPDAELTIQSQIKGSNRRALASRVGQRVLGTELVLVLGIRGDGD